MTSEYGSSDSHGLLVGRSEPTGRAAVAALVQAELLASDTPKGPVRLHRSPSRRSGCGKGAADGHFESGNFFISQVLE